MTYPDWTDAEDAIIARLYPKGGAGACMPFLPGRSPQSIRVHAHKRGIHRERPQPGTAQDSKPPPLRQYKKKRRDCLCCQNEFVSDGPHNRICRQCKGRESWQSAGASLNVARRCLTGTFSHGFMEHGKDET